MKFATILSTILLLAAGCGGSGSFTEDLGSTPPPTAASGPVAWLPADVPSAVPDGFKAHVDAYHDLVAPLEGVTTNGSPVVARWTSAPVVQVDPSNTVWTADVVREAVAYFRAILPADTRPVFGGPADTEREGSIWITEAWTAPLSFPGYTQMMWISSGLGPGHASLVSGTIGVNRNPYPTRTDANAARARSAAGRADTLIHELYHAMGLGSDIYDPATGAQFPDGRLNNTLSRNPNATRFGLVDTGALIKHYHPTEWGEWAGDVGGVQSTVGALSFYTRTFGAFAIPGYHGVASTGRAPDTSATWTGGLAGIAGGVAVNGTSRLHWTGAELDASFTWGAAGRADYDLTMTARGAFHDDGSEVFGRVLGRAGEYVGGTITRPDLTGAFGGRRD